MTTRNMITTTMVLTLTITIFLTLASRASAASISIVDAVYTGNTAGDVTLEDKNLANLRSGSGFGPVVAMAKRSASNGDVVFASSDGTLYSRNPEIGSVYSVPAIGTVSALAMRSDNATYVGLEDGGGIVQIRFADGMFGGLVAGVGTGIRAMDVQSNGNVVWGRRNAGTGDIFIRDSSLNPVAVVGSVGEFSTLSVRPADDSIYLGIANDGGTLQRRDSILDWLGLSVNNLGGDFTAMDTLSNGNVVFANTAGGGSLFIRDELLAPVFGTTPGIAINSVVARSDGSFYVGYANGTLELRAFDGTFIDDVTGLGTISVLSVATGGSLPSIPEPMSAILLMFGGVAALSFRPRRQR